MHSRLALALALVAYAAACGTAQAQAPAAASAPAARPLQSLPYTPSLDISSLDRTADPCVDFYQYTCGGWKTNNPIPADQASWSVYAKLGTDNQQFLWGILEEDAKAANRTPVQQKVGDYYAACMDTGAIDAAGLAPLRSELARIDALATRAALIEAVGRLHHEALGSFFFASGTDQDAADASVIIVDLEAAGLGLPDRDYYLKSDAKSVEIRAQYSAFVARMLVLAGTPEAQAARDAQTILGLETELAKASLTRVERRDPHRRLAKGAGAVERPLRGQAEVGPPETGLQAHGVDHQRDPRPEHPRGEGDQAGPQAARRT